MTTVVTHVLEDQAIGKGEEETNDLEEEESPPNDDDPSVVLAFKVIHGVEVLTAPKAILGDTPPPKPPKSYSIRSTGSMSDAMLEDKKRAMLRRILPPSNTS